MSSRRHDLLSALLIQNRPGVVDWLTKNITIPKSMSPARVKGSSSNFSLAGQSFARHILESANPANGITDVTVCGATQVFKTFGMLMIVCYRIVNAPMPMLIVFPTKDTAQKAVSRKKLQPLIRGNPMLAALMPSNSDMFTDMEMAMLGGAIRLTGTNSPANLASTSEGIILQDEVCKFEHHESEDSPESHPMLLADERASDFGSDAYRYKSSSPNHVMHPFWRNYEAGSQTHFLVTCPNCSHHFPFEDYPDSVHDATHIGYEKCGPDYKAIRWDQNARDAKGQWDEHQLRESARYHCPGCDYPIDEHQRRIMLDDVIPYALNPTASKTHLSFRLPKFYTTSQTIGSIAWNRVKPGDLFDNSQHHQNSWLANPWQDVQASIKTEDVRKLANDSNYYRRHIPRKPMAVIMGADVGDYKQHWAAGAVYEDYSLDVVDYDTTLALEDLIGIQNKLRYDIANSGEKIQPQSGLVDSKDRTLDVFTMCRRSGGFWYPSAGVDTSSGTWGVTPANYQRPDLYSFVTHQFKKHLYLEKIKKRQDPRLGLPRDASEEFVKGLSGQQLVIVNKKEHFKVVAGDHYGDCVIRLILGIFILRAKRGEAAPDMPSENATVNAM